MNGEPRFTQSDESLKWASARTKALVIWAGYMEGMHGFGVSTGKIANIAQFCNEQRTSAWHGRLGRLSRLALKIL